jgi:hypothetical protein
MMFKSIKLPNRSRLKVKQVENITQQQKQLKSIDSPIKMVDIIVTEEKFTQSVFSEFEGQITEPDADIRVKVKMITMDKEQESIDSVQAFNTFRGGTELRYNSRRWRK